ncbi:hypothetical protein ACFSUK_31030 [Sphingobium scionense]|uniref:YxiG-like domain-containing protein n=1 Tax=Sphingobium scionense TaxID=1404341 RepID=A0A7W6PZR2_9SPHN|nr:hypothetical protein [Sphingobium scionense]MBB4151662.1 hypothetical protein [Sphingobium scionense]
MANMVPSGLKGAFPAKSSHVYTGGSEKITPYQRFAGSIAKKDAFNAHMAGLKSTNYCLFYNASMPPRADLAVRWVIVHKLTVHPLSILFEHGLPELDIGVMSHGFTEHGRDYFFVIEDCIGVSPGTYRLTFTHVVELEYGTAISPATWSTSWSDEFTDYARWEAAGEPEGYVFGTNWGRVPGGGVGTVNPRQDRDRVRVRQPELAG